MKAERSLHPVPPSPDVLSVLYMEYLRVAKPLGLTFKQYLEVTGYGNPARDVTGMDDRAVLRTTPEGPVLIDIPSQPITGTLPVIVLLVDFPDKPGAVPKRYYEDLLFSNNTFPSGSMRDYYREVSLGQVDVTGTVHGWLRMPRPYSYYTNNESGTGYTSYPRNAQRMAEDAVRVALDNGIPFDATLDKLGQGIITALFIVHAGRGAEVLHPAIRGSEIWSHKWVMREPIQVAPNLDATIYLTVPEDCKIGVCAHELGHLAFQWQDFYDPNYDQDGTEWDGSGRWDLMAGGSYNGDGARPAHPAGLHKAQHGWVEVQRVRQTAGSVAVELPPYSATAGKVVRVESVKYRQGQYLILENRRKVGFDFDLPGEGLLVWRVDESAEMEAPDAPGLYLIQADGRHDLEDPGDWNEGDTGDPFPGSSGAVELRDAGPISTSFPGQSASGVSLSNIRVAPETGVITLDITFV
jgi:immune inhibitor A